MYVQTYLKTALVLWIVIFSRLTTTSADIFEYGDFVGTNVTYSGVFEDTYDDSSDRFFQPMAQENSLIFNPDYFTFASGTGIDVANGAVAFSLLSNSTGLSNVHFGQNGSAAVTGMSTTSLLSPVSWVVTHVDGVPLGTPLHGNSQMVYEPDSTFTSPPPNQFILWNGNLDVDLDDFLFSNNVSGRATRVEFRLEKTITSSASNGDAFNAINDVQGLTITERPDFSLVFREMNPDFKDGSWGPIIGGSNIPGFDHVGLNVHGFVFEAHPGYMSGDYHDLERDLTIPVQDTRGVQQMHTRGSFRHNSMSPTETKVIDLLEIQLPDDLAISMRSEIQAVAGAGFLDTDFLPFIVNIANLLPHNQKGGDDQSAFTCVGLVEYAAEQAGHKDGQGFIPNQFELVEVGSLQIPMLSPWLLSVYAREPIYGEVVTGTVDPVDFIVTDPLGRRFGYTEATGFLDEIPNVFYTGNGDLEQFVITNAIEGDYAIELFGLGADAAGGFATSTDQEAFAQFLDEGETIITQVTVVPEPHSMTMLLLLAICSSNRICQFQWHKIDRTTQGA